MKKLIAIICMFMASTAFAATSSSGLSSSDLNSAGFSKLSEAEKAELIKQVADKAATKDSFGRDREVSTDKVEKWVQIGTNIGQGLAGAAKEVGVAVNDFSKTPVGQLTMVLIVWHMIGAQLLHVFGGIMIWIIGFAAIRFFFNKVYQDRITYSTTQKNIFGNFAITSVEKTSMRDDEGFGWLVCSAFVLIAGLIAIFTY